MAHYKDRDGRGELRGNEGGDVREHKCCRARETAVGRLGDRAAPAALVEAVDLDALGSEIGEEVVVAVHVVAEAMEKNELGFHWTDGLGGGVSDFAGGDGEEKGRGVRSYGPGLGVEADIADFEGAFFFGGHDELGSGVRRSESEAVSSPRVAARRSFCANILVRGRE